MKIGEGWAWWKGGLRAKEREGETKTETDRDRQSDRVRYRESRRNSSQMDGAYISAYSLLQLWVLSAE